MFDWWWDFLFNLARGLLSVIDGVYKLFLVLAGVAPGAIQQEVTGDASSGNILEAFFKSPSIQYVFWAFMVISFFVLFVAILIGIAKSEFAEDNKQPKLKVIKRSLLSLFTVLAMPVIFAVSLMMVTYLLTAIVELMGGTIYADSNLPQKLFEICLPSPSRSIENISIVWTDPISQIRQFYNLEGYNFLLAFLGGFIIVFILGIGTLTLVERLINVILLFLVSPFVLAVAPLDDGQRFGVWRDLLISKLLGVGGMIISLYLYFLLLGLANDFFDRSSFLSQLAFLLFAIGGALTATKGGTLIANIVGHNAGMAEGQSQQQTGHMVGTGLMAGLKTAGGLAMGSLGLLRKGGAAAAGHMFGGGERTEGSGLASLLQGGDMGASQHIQNNLDSPTTFSMQMPDFYMPPIVIPPLTLPGDPPMTFTPSQTLQGAMGFDRLELNPGIGSQPPNLEIPGGQPTTVGEQLQATVEPPAPPLAGGLTAELNKTGEGLASSGDSSKQGGSN